MTDVNRTGFRAEENVCEEAKEKDTNPKRVSDLEIWKKKKKGFFQIRHGHEKVNGEPLLFHRINIKENLGWVTSQA